MKKRALPETGRDSPDDTITRTIEREIALVLDHMDRLRSLHEKLRDNLLQMRCYTDTELIQMEDRTPQYSPYRFPEREKLQRRLLALEKERRQLALSEEDKLQELHKQLLSLLNRHNQLSPSEHKHHKKRLFTWKRVSDPEKAQ